MSPCVDNALTFFGEQHDNKVLAAVFFVARTVRRQELCVRMLLIYNGDAFRMWCGGEQQLYL